MDFSSGHAILTIMDFKPKATSFVSKEMFFAPSSSNTCLACFSISCKLSLGDDGMIFRISAAIPIFFFVFMFFKYMLNCAVMLLND